MSDCRGTYPRADRVQPYELGKHDFYGLPPRPAYRTIYGGALGRVSRPIMRAAVAQGYSHDQARAIVDCYLAFTPTLRA